VALKDLERLLDEVSNVFPLLLAVVDTISGVQVLVLEDVHDGEDLAVVWDERLAHEVGGDHQVLQDLEGGAQHLVVPHAQRVLDGDDELRDDREDLGAAVLQHVVDALAREELVRVRRLAQAVEEQGEVVVVVQLLNLHLPCDFVSLCVVLEGNGEVAALVELAEAGGGHGAGLEGASIGWPGHLPLELFTLFSLCLHHFGGFSPRFATLSKW